MSIFYLGFRPRTTATLEDLASIGNGPPNDSDIQTCARVLSAMQKNVSGTGADDLRWERWGDILFQIKCAEDEAEMVRWIQEALSQK
jgi:hypothetical protein